MFVALESMCHCLDLEFATITNSAANFTPTFRAHHALILEVNNMLVELRQEKERKMYLEQTLTALMLTTSIDNLENTGIPTSLTTVKAKIQHLVSYHAFMNYMH